MPAAQKRKQMLLFPRLRPGQLRKTRLKLGMLFSYLSLSLNDLTTIKPAVEKFLVTESRLDVLFNNASVSSPPRGSVSPQGHELQLATNCLGPHLLT